MIHKIGEIAFPKYSGIRCLMMPYIQGEPDSVPDEYRGYAEILRNLTIQSGDIGYLTIDESLARKGKPHRGTRSSTARALHTEVGRRPNKIYAWGGGGWASNHDVELERDVQVILANNMTGTCALWDTEHEDTSMDGDIGHYSEYYPYSDAEIMRAGHAYQIGILTPHESLAVHQDSARQFLRIVSSGVHGREPYFTENPLLP